MSLFYSGWHRWSELKVTTFYSVADTNERSVMVLHNTCALVSTAGGLLAQKEGALINAHDVIIRTGTAPIESFEAHVGNRTHFRVLSTSFLRDVNITRMKRNLGTENIVYVNGRCARADTILNRKSGGICFTPSPCMYLKNYRKQYSTGLFAFLASFQLLGCTMVTLYGFNTSLNEAYPYHYWRDGSSHDRHSALSWYESRKKWGHEFGNEHKFYRKMTNADGQIHKVSFSLFCEGLEIQKKASARDQSPSMHWNIS